MGGVGKGKVWSLYGSDLQYCILLYWKFLSCVIFVLLIGILQISFVLQVCPTNSFLSNVTAVMPIQVWTKTRKCSGVPVNYRILELVSHCATITCKLTFVFGFCLSNSGNRHSTAVEVSEPLANSRASEESRDRAHRQDAAANKA